MYGIDISHWQGKDFFNKFARLQRDIGAEIEFVIMKATEGCTYTDPLFHSYIAEVKRRNLLAGAYHFARPDNDNTAREEAKNFVATIRPYLTDPILLALDWEGNAAKQSDSTWVKEWCDTVFGLTGVKPVVYCGIGNVKRLKEVADADYGLWVARWPKNGKEGTPGVISPWNFWAIWQYTNKPVDTDIFNGNKNQWYAYCAQKHIPPMDGGGVCHCGCQYCCEEEEQ